MRREQRAFFRGLATMRQLTGAERVTVALKRKNEDLVDLMRDDAQQAGCEFFVYEDVYPAGDEYVLVYEITGRQIPPGGLPLHVDCVVDNVETIINVGKAVDGTPVTEKYVTITGAVHHPLTTVVPIGTPFQDCLRAAGGCTVDDPTFLVSGVMMGGVSKDLLHAGDQDHGRTHRAALGPLPGASQDGSRAKRTRASATASATSVRSAPNSARATSWAIRSNRTASCARC